MIPRLVEGGLGIRVWTGLVQLAEARLGEPLGLEASLATPIDWPEAEKRLLDAVEQTWERRNDATLREIEQELTVLVPDGVAASDAVLARALVRMSYGQRTLFDRRTHQRRAVVVARLSYPFPAARLLADRDSEALKEDILAHLSGAQSEVEVSIGRAELRRLPAGGLADLPAAVQTELVRLLGAEAWEELSQVDSVEGLSQDRKEALERALGRVLLNRLYRGLILAVGDRLWVDYLTQMEGLRTAIGLEAYGQRDPLVQYKSRAFDMFSHLQSDIRAAVVARLFRSPAPARPAAASAGRTPAEAEAEPGSAPPPGDGPVVDETSRKKRRRRH
jgi:preprotein translocase subunit SecA